MKLLLALIECFIVGPPKHLRLSYGLSRSHSLLQLRERSFGPSDEARKFIKENEDDFLAENKWTTKEQSKALTGNLDDVLEELEITTIQDLQDKRSTVKVVSMLRGAGYESEKMFGPLDDIFAVPEIKLDGQILSLASGGYAQKSEPEIELLEERFVQEVHKKDLGPPKGDRECDIVIVLGPSGSGKTFYAVRGLSIPKPHVIVYAKLSERGVDLFNDEEKFEEKLKKSLMSVAKAYDGKTPLNMTVSVVLDEASGVGERANDFNHLRELYERIQKFAVHPRLVLVGTGLDKITKDLASDAEVRKHRMQRWGLTQVEAIVSKKYDQADKDRILGQIKRCGLYQNLATNARSASFLVDAIGERVQWDTQEAQVGDVVQEVSRKYISNNCLRDLREAARRRRFARAAFMALDESSKRVGQPFFPEESKAFEELLSVTEQRCFVSLFEVNVETKVGTNELVNGNVPYSLTMSSALVVVMLALLDVVGSLRGGWKEFETMVAFHELQHLVMNMNNETLIEDGVRMFFLRNPFPATNAKSNFKIPELASNAVYVNGPMAPFADVIAPFRLCQCKFVRDPESTTAELSSAEFVKLGIVVEQDENTALGSPLKSALLSAVYGAWAKKKPVSCEDFSDEAPLYTTLAKPTNSGDARTPRQGYPMCQLAQQEEKNFWSVVDASYDDTTCQLAVPQWGETFSSSTAIEEKVAAVFYTNAKQFRIYEPGTQKGEQEDENSSGDSTAGTRKNKETFVSPSDVDVDGSITEEKKKEIYAILRNRDSLGDDNDEKVLRDGVDLKFVFLFNHNEEYFEEKKLK